MIDKRCNLCGDWKPLTAFPRWTLAGIDARRGTCKACCAPKRPHRGVKRRPAPLPAARENHVVIMNGIPLQCRVNLCMDADDAESEEERAGAQRR